MSGQPIVSYTEVRCDYGTPDHGDPAPGIMQVFYKDGVPEMVDFLCPCGCGKRTPTHLVQPGNPKVWNVHCWNYAPGPTLTPSIRFLSGCKAHFNITDGKVIMHGDSGQ